MSASNESPSNNLIVGAFAGLGMTIITLAFYRFFGKDAITTLSWWVIIVLGAAQLLKLWSTSFRLYFIKAAMKDTWWNTPIYNGAIMWSNAFVTLWLVYWDWEIPAIMNVVFTMFFISDQISVIEYKRAQSESKNNP